MLSSTLLLAAFTATPLHAAVAYGGFSEVVGSVFDFTVGKYVEGKDPHAASGSSANGTFSGTALAETLVPGSGRILLHASASTSCPPDGDHEFGPPGVLATASWSDVLKMKNPDVVPVPVLASLYFYFAPTFSGTVTGRASASLYLNVGNLSISDSESSGTFKNRVVLKINGSLLGFVDDGEEPPMVPFTMTLSAQSTSFPGTQGMADISHTVSFDAIYVGDADGNPLPNTPPIEFTSAAGFSYTVAPIPEPGLALTPLAATLLLSRRPRR